MTLEEANKYADEMDKLNDEREEFIKKLTRVRCSDKHREFIEWLLTEENPCDTCGYEEGSIYCKEHCPHEAKIEQEPTNTKLMLMEANINGYAQGLKDSSKVESSGDLISREETLTAFADYVGSGMSMNDFDALWDIVAKMPAVNPTKTEKWIPVSERLPKIADVYRVTRYYPNNVMNPNYLVDACFFDGSNTWYNDNRINHERDYANNVIAWQGNPEPYEPQESEE